MGQWYAGGVLGGKHGNKSRRGMLKPWTRAGRDPHSFTAAERLNIIADKLAGGASEAETSQPATQEVGSLT